MARLLIVTALLHLPHGVSGAQRSLHALAQGLQQRGHAVAVLSGIRARTFASLKDRLRRASGGRSPAVCDNSNGYPTWRSWDPVACLAGVAEAFRPDLLVGHNVDALSLRRARPDLPLLVQLLDAFFAQYNIPAVAQDPAVRVLANSRFIADRFARSSGQRIGHVAPIVDPAEVRVERPGEAVVFVNPVAMKGLEIAVALAAMNPDIPFVFVEGYPLGAEVRRRLRERLAPLPHVRLLRSVADPRRIYRQARLLLVPSQVEEAWGRVATEAQVSGIPVLASATGGLGEAVGPGGLLVEPSAPAEQWSAALGALWRDPALYLRCSEAALAHSRRAAVSAPVILDQYERLIATLLAAPAAVPGHAPAGVRTG